MKPAREVEFEVVDDKQKRTSPSPAHPLAALIARLMDSQFVIPGTTIRFGLDPLISLLPGLGPTASAAVSIAMIALSAKQGVPRTILARMAGNVLLNAVFDAVPIAGDALSIFFRSNARNYDLLRQHAGTSRRVSRGGDWLFLAALFGGVILILLLILVGAVTLLAKLYTSLQPHAPAWR